MAKSKTPRQQTSASGKAKTTKTKGDKAARIKKNSAVQTQPTPKAEGQIVAVPTAESTMPSGMEMAAGTEPLTLAEAAPSAATVPQPAAKSAGATKSKTKRLRQTTGSKKLSALDAAVKVLAEA